MEKLEARLRWNEAIVLLEEYYKRKYNVSEMSISYSDEEKTGYSDDHDGFPPEEYTYTSRQFTISFTKKAGNLTIPCSIKRSCSQIEKDLTKIVSELLKSTDCELDQLIIWGSYCNFAIEYTFHIKTKEKEKILK